MRRRTGDDGGRREGTPKTEDAPGQKYHEAQRCGADAKSRPRGDARDYGSPRTARTSRWDAGRRRGRPLPRVRRTRTTSCIRCDTPCFQRGHAQNKMAPQHGPTGASTLQVAMAAACRSFPFVFTMDDSLSSVPPGRGACGRRDRGRGRGAASDGCDERPRQTTPKYALQRLMAERGAARGAERCGIASMPALAYGVLCLAHARHNFWRPSGAKTAPGLGWGPAAKTPRACCRPGHVLSCGLFFCLAARASLASTGTLFLVFVASCLVCHGEASLHGPSGPTAALAALFRRTGGQTSPLSLPAQTRPAVGPNQTNAHAPRFLLPWLWAQPVPFSASPHRPPHLLRCHSSFFLSFFGPLSFVSLAGRSGAALTSARHALPMVGF